MLKVLGKGRCCWRRPSSAQRNGRLTSGAYLPCNGCSKVHFQARASLPQPPLTRALPCGPPQELVWGTLASNSPGTGKTANRGRTARMPVLCYSPVMQRSLCQYNSSSQCKLCKCMMLFQICCCTRGQMRHLMSVCTALVTRCCLTASQNMSDNLCCLWGTFCCLFRVCKDFVSHALSGPFVSLFWPHVCRQASEDQQQRYPECCVQTSLTPTCLC